MLLAVKPEKWTQRRDFTVLLHFWEKTHRHQGLKILPTEKSLMPQRVFLISVENEQFGISLSYLPLAGLMIHTGNRHALHRHVSMNNQQPSYVFSEDDSYHGDNAIDITELGWLHSRHGTRVDVNAEMNEALCSCSQEPVS